MEKHRILSVEDGVYSSLMEMFAEAFPESERRPREWFDELVEGEKRFHCMVWGESDAMLCWWELEWSDGKEVHPFVYVEYLAVRRELRGKGIGKAVMRDFLCGLEDVPVVLEVEPPVCGQTRGRVRFYERLGFRLLPDYYMQPSYGVVPGVELKLMVRDSIVQGTIDVGMLAETIRRDVYVVTPNA